MITKFKIFENKNNFNKIIDYTFLKKNAKIDDIKRECDVAVENGYYSVVVYPECVGTAVAFLDDTNIKVCSVISFPKGNDKTNQKLKEAMTAISDGAEELDVVFDYGLLNEMLTKKEDEYQDLYEDLLYDTRSVVELAHKDGVVIKFIIEVDELDLNGVKIATDICLEAGVDFIVTSTGFSKKGTFEKRLEAIKYIRRITPDYMKIKATGGIRSMEHINVLLPLVDRIGTSIIINNQE